MPFPRLLLLCSVLFCFGVNLARARIGETPEQCRQRYGVPFLSDPGHTVFRESGLIIVVTFYDEKADSVTYFKAEGDAQKNSLPLSDAEQQAMLRANGGEHTWQKLPTRSPTCRGPRTTAGSRRSTTSPRTSSGSPPGTPWSARPRQRGSKRPSRQKTNPREHGASVPRRRPPTRRRITPCRSTTRHARCSAERGMATKVFRWTRQIKAYHLRFALKAYQRVGITHFRLLGGCDGRDCQRCRTLVGRTFRVDDAPPDLPPAACTCEPGGSRLCAIAAGCGPTSAVAGARQGDGARNIDGR